MKTLLFAAAVAAIAALNVAPASAAQYGAPVASVGNPHYEWQYHYVGHHAHYEGHWVWVK